MTEWTAAERRHGWDFVHYSVERRFTLPANAPPRVLEDIETYSAFIELQGKMSGPAFWYQKLC